jgi:hypothetical protein
MIESITGILLFIEELAYGVWIISKWRFDVAKFYWIRWQYPHVVRVRLYPFYVRKELDDWLGNHNDVKSILHNTLIDNPGGTLSIKDCCADIRFKDISVAVEFKFAFADHIYSLSQG